MAPEAYFKGTRKLYLTHKNSEEKLILNISNS
jgi:hypothetical protein